MLIVTSIPELKVGPTQCPAPITDYQSKVIPPGQWAVIEQFVRDAVKDFGPADARQASYLMTVLGRHVHWCWQVAAYPLDRQVVFRREVIAESVQRGMTAFHPRTRATVRSKLLRMSEALLVGPHRHVRLPPLPNGPSQDPYTEKDVVLLRAWADQQNTEYRTVNANVLLSLALGAGLSAQELGGVRARHVTIDDEGVLVQVVAGRSPRTVPVVAAWESAVAAVASASMRPDQFVFLPLRVLEYHRNLVPNFTFDTINRPTQVSASRMRTTWIVNHLRRGTPPALLARAAGLDSTERLGIYLAHVPDLDPAEGRRMLRMARGSNP